jgi:hypothetical protein
MPSRIVFLDTSFVVALENMNDPHHGQAKALDRRLLKEDDRRWLRADESPREGNRAACTIRR